jgi:hypothetical protein
MLERLNADLRVATEGYRQRSGHSCSRSACRTECALRRA